MLSPSLETPLLTIAVVTAVYMGVLAGKGIVDAVKDKGEARSEVVFRKTF